MRLRSGASVLLLVLAACGSSSAASSSSTTTPVATKCGPSNAKTVLVDRKARVFERAGLILGCADAGKRRYRLGSATNCLRSARARPVVLAGSMVAYGLQVCGIDTGSALVIVQDLINGQQLRVLDATTDGHAVESYQEITALVVTADGAVAWIAILRSIIHRGRYVEVHRADSRGQTMLDSGSTIALASLRLRGSRLSWRDGSATRTATLR